MRSEGERILLGSMLVHRSTFGVEPWWFLDRRNIVIANFIEASGFDLIRLRELLIGYEIEDSYLSSLPDTTLSLEAARIVASLLPK